MLHGIREKTVAALAAEDAAKLVEALDLDGLVDGTALAAADERRDRAPNERNGMNAEPRAGTAQWEAFSPPPAQVAGAGQAVRLEFARSGLRAEGDDQRSLLEQAEARGLKPKHGCRQGICTECTCQLLEGRVRDLRSGRETSEPGQPIRICVSAPLGDVRIDL